MAQAKRDENRVTSLLGVSTLDSLTPVVIAANPTTKRLYTDALVTDYIGTQTRSVASVTVDDTAGGTAIVAAAATTRSFIIYNNGANTVYLGPNGVTAATGLPLTSGSSFDESNINIALYGITSAGSSDIRVMKIVEA